MPRVYQYRCSNWGWKDSNERNIQWKCRFNFEYDGPYEYVKMDDGSEIFYSHFKGEDYLLKLTGKTTDQLLKEKRIFFRDSEFCLECRHFKNDCKCEKPNLIDISKLEGMKCPECGVGVIEKKDVGIS